MIAGQKVTMQRRRVTKKAKKQTPGRMKATAASNRGGVPVTREKRIPVPNVSPEERLRLVQGMILTAMENIIEAVIKQAQKGKYTDARFLFELAGVKMIPLPEKSERQGGDSLCAILLRRLAEVPMPSPEQQPAANQKNLYGGLPAARN